MRKTQICTSLDWRTGIETRHNGFVHVYGGFVSFDTREAVYEREENTRKRGLHYFLKIVLEILLKK